MAEQNLPDWETPVEGKAPTATPCRDEITVNAARQMGAEIKTVKKFNAGTNKAANTLNTRKLDNETENFAHAKVPAELKKAIIQGRLDKKLSQSELAKNINEKVQVVQEYESGRAIPNERLIIKFEKALEIKLPRNQLPRNKVLTIKNN